MDKVTPWAIVIKDLERVPIPISISADCIFFTDGTTTNQKDFAKKIAKKYFGGRQAQDYPTDAVDKAENALLLLLDENIYNRIYNCSIFDDIYTDDDFSVQRYSSKEKTVISETKKPKTKQQTIFEAIER